VNKVGTVRRYVLENYVFERCEIGARSRDEALSKIALGHGKTVEHRTFNSRCRLFPQEYERKGELV